MAIWDREDETEWEKYQRSRGRRGRPSPPPPAETEEPQGEREPVLEKLLGRLRPEKPEEPEGPPERCPWCGGEMVKGYLWAGGGNILWLPRKPKPWITSADAGPGELEIAQEGTVWRFKTAWHCPACQRVALDLARAGERPEALKKTGRPAEEPEDE